jgi:hypothetical protein
MGDHLANVTDTLSKSLAALAQHSI